MAIRTTYKYACDLDKGTYEVNLRNPLMQADSQADAFRVSLTRNGADVDVSGMNAYGYLYVASTQMTIALNGTVSGNAAEVVLTSDCYAAPGYASLVIQLHEGDVRHAVLKANMYIERTGKNRVLTGGDVLPTLAELLGQIAAMEQATAAARTAAAEADAVREGIQGNLNNLSGKIDALAANGIRLDTVWELGSIKSDDGSNTESMTTRIRTGYLDVADIAVLVDVGFKAGLHFYDADKAYLPAGYAPFASSALRVSLVAPDGAAYFRVVAATEDDADLTERVDEAAEKVRLLAPNKEYVEHLHQDALAYADRMRTKVEMALYTEFEYLPGRWDLVGGIGTTGYHSQLIPVNEGETYYIGYRSASASCGGAFFDANGVWCNKLRTSETTVHEYQNADGNGERTDYAEIYAFTVPAGARFVSLNLTDNEAVKYHQYISSKPVFALENSGSYIIYEGDPAYQAKKDKSLCVIGASGVTIDRLNPGKSDFSQYIVGFQEYLAPWYRHVGSYGFWSGSWAGYDKNDPSIYSGIVTKGVDLSGYDEFLLIPSTADVEITGIGEIDSTDPTNYMGGLNGVIDYIYKQSPMAKIYLVNASHKGKYFTDATVKARMDEINEKLAQLCALHSYQLIDVACGGGTNNRTYMHYTYDGTHLNQEGSKKLGLYIRKEIIGI